MTKQDLAELAAAAFNEDGSWATDDADTFQGSSTVVDKKDLKGVPLMILGITFNPGAEGRLFASAEFVLQDNPEPAVFNDGGTGVAKQLEDYLTAKGLVGDGNPVRPGYRYPVKLICRRGLRVSEYEAPGGRPASTYYLA